MNKLEKRLNGTEKMESYKIYTECVNSLTKFYGRNSTYDEIILECKYDLDYSIEVLKSILENQLEELFNGKEEEEERNFLNKMLNKINTIA